MTGQILAILETQWRVFVNFWPRKGAGSILLTAVLAAGWYGAWVTAAVAAALLTADPGSEGLVARGLSPALFLGFLYWQVMPILMASVGASLDIRRLLVYPIPNTRLFLIDVLLRATAGVEVLLVLAGAAAGLLLNPRVPVLAPLAFLPYVLFNLLLLEGVRDLLGRLTARKRVREAAVLLLVILAALPQLLLLGGVPGWMERAAARMSGVLWPWTATALAVRDGGVRPWIVIVLWAAAAYVFARVQFSRSLRFDERAAAANDRAPSGAGRLERLASWPALVFADPMAALIEKEIRFLGRAPRFRLVFLMGFSFGLIIWIPFAFGESRAPGSMLADNFLTVVCVYALMLIGEVAFWNNLGFDRAAAQVYFVAPIRFSTVLKAKNIATLFFAVLEVAAVALVCRLLGMPAGALKMLEALGVTLIFALYMLAVGNLSSLYQPKSVDPAHSWKSGWAGRFQLLLLVVYPLLALPLLLAYVARYAFDSNAAFYGVLAFALCLGLVLYWVSFDSAVAAAEKRRERLLAALGESRGPISA